MLQLLPIAAAAVAVDGFLRLLVDNSCLRRCCPPPYCLLGLFCCLFLSWIALGLAVGCALPTFRFAFFLFYAGKTVPRGTLHSCILKLSTLQRRQEKSLPRAAINKNRNQFHHHIKHDTRRRRTTTRQQQQQQRERCRCILHNNSTNCCFFFFFFYVPRV